MENSLDSSPESTVSGSKAVFKKPKDFHQAFEVSLEESYAATQDNKSDFDLDTTSGTNKALPFQKSRKSIQHSFNVSSGESLVNNESEQSVTFTKPQALFTKKNKSLVDFFNVSFNETNLQEDALGGSIDCDDSVTTHKTNPFAKNKNEAQNEVSMKMDTSLPVSEQGTQNEVSVEMNTSLPVSEQGAENEVSMRRGTSLSVSEQEVENEVSMRGGTPLSVSDPEAENEVSMRMGTPASVSDQGTQNEVSMRMGTPVSVSDQGTQNEVSMRMGTPLSISDQGAENEVSIRVDTSLPVSEQGTQNEVSVGMDTSLPVPDEEAQNDASFSFRSVANTKEKSQSSMIKMTTISPKEGNSSNKSKVNVEKKVISKENVENKYKPPKLLKPASFATKQLYAYIIKKLQPKYGIDTMLESENLVSLMCDTVKKVTRRKTHQKRLIQNLKKEMAKAGLIETTVDFYEFIIKFLPYSFRVKVVPCLQPMTNMVYPPKDVANPFDKVL